MTSSTPVSPEELGRALARLRQSADKRQSDLASEIDISAAVLSRIESGERAASNEELQRIVSAIGTNEALALPAALARQWEVLTRPPLDHPDGDLLWEADKASSRLGRFREGQSEIREAFRTRIEEYLGELERSSENVALREYLIVLIGKVGIGKSTALCRLAGLEIPGDGGAAPTPVFATGTGRITICEVHLKTGNGYGITIDPASYDEVRDYAYEFAEQFFRDESGGRSEGEDAEEHVGISAEVNRAIRNMTLLTTTKNPGDAGKTVRIDEAKKLARLKADKRDFVLEVLSRMDLPRRDRRDIWYHAGASKSPLQWLQKVFADINSGRHSEFTIPKRIEVTVENTEITLVPAGDLSVRLVDTQGVDEVAARPDLERFFGMTHTVITFCSGFNDAPSETANFLLGRAKAAGRSDLHLNSRILVLPHPGQALEICDDSGLRAESTDEGYELKKEEVEASLRKQGLADIDVGFFNAREDDVERAHTFLAAALGKLRNSYRDSLRKAIDDSNSLLDNYGRDQVELVLKEAARQLNRLLDEIGTLGGVAGHIEDSVIDRFNRGVHHATVKATVRRNGEWYNFNYGHHLSSGARQMAVSTLGPKIEKFRHGRDFLSNDPNLKEAGGLISQAWQVLTDAYNSLLRRAELVGESFFKDTLKRDTVFWVTVGIQRGRGYTEDVRKENRKWFDASHRKVEAELQEMLEAEWGIALGKVRSILPLD